MTTNATFTGSFTTYNMNVIMQDVEKSQNPDVFEIPMADSDGAVGLLFSGALRRISIEIIIIKETAAALKTELDTLDTFCAGGSETGKDIITYTDPYGRSFNVIIERIKYRHEISEVGAYNVRPTIEMVEVSE